MDPVHDVPPAARTHHDHLQLLAATVTALAAGVERLAQLRERHAREGNDELRAARADLRRALRYAPASADRSSAAFGHADAPSAEPSTARTGGGGKSERPMTASPEQEDAMVLAAHYGTFARRLAEHPTSVATEQGVTLPMAENLARQWIDRVVVTAQSGHGHRWEQPPNEKIGAWASEAAARARCDLHRQRAVGWAAQADQLAESGASPAAAVSRRRADEATMLADYWSEKADRLAAGGPAYPDPANARELADAFDALDLANAAQTRAATFTDIAGPATARATADLAMPDLMSTPHVDEHAEGTARASTEWRIVAADEQRTAAAGARAAAAEVDGMYRLSAAKRPAPPMSSAAPAMRSVYLLHQRPTGPSR